MVIVLLVSILFSILSSAIMSYIALSTATGPWIEPTLVLLGIFIYRFIFCHICSINIHHAIGFSTISGSIGGIVAIACSWTIPTLYFLDATLFNTWLANPYYFFSIIAFTILTAGMLGFTIANYLEHHFIEAMNISFPIGQLTYKMIYAQDQIKKTFELLAGAILTTSITIINKCSSYVLDKINLIPALSYGLFRIPAICLRFDLFPIFLSIGFVTGHVIALPLLFGLLSKIVFIEPIQRYFFQTIPQEIFLNAFVSGIVIQGAVLAIFELPHILKTTFAQTNNNQLNKTIKNSSIYKNRLALCTIACLLLLQIIFFYFFEFSFLSQLYLLIFTLICTYQVLLIAGKTGLAPFPRFATFVLVPGMLIFGFSAVQIMIVSAFVEICCGVAVDVLFGRKMAKLADMNRAHAIALQLLGLIVSALVIGVIFYVLIQRFGLGSPELVAQRAHARALLVSNQNFDYIIMILGGIFGFSLKCIKMNYLLVIGSLLMQPELSFSLIVGGLLTYLVKNKEAYYPFWSGMFAASSLLMLLHSFIVR